MCVKNTVFGVFKKLYGVDLAENSCTSQKILWLHFFISQSYTILQKIVRGMSKVTQGELTFDSMAQVRSYRDSLPVGNIKVFTNPEGSNIGRMWPHKDMFTKVFDKQPIVAGPRAQLFPGWVCFPTSCGHFSLRRT